MRENLKQNKQQELPGPLSGGLDPGCKGLRASRIFCAPHSKILDLPLNGVPPPPPPPPIRIPAPLVFTNL